MTNRRVLTIMAVIIVVAGTLLYDAPTPVPSEPTASTWECDSWRYVPSGFDYKPVCR